TQPSVPSRSRIRRQFSNSAVISTGSAERVYTQATSWSLFGPPRTLTWSDFRLANRGNGRPLPSLWSLAACAGRATGAAVMTAADRTAIRTTIGARMKRLGRCANIMAGRARAESLLEAENHPTGGVAGCLTALAVPPCDPCFVLIRSSDREGSHPVAHTALVASRAASTMRG